MRKLQWLLVSVLIVMLASRLASAAPLVLVQDGEARAAIWSYGDAERAVSELSKYMEQITGAKLEVRTIGEGEKVPAGTPAMVVGKLAYEMDLPAPPKTISGDGYRVLRRGDLLLMAGESDNSTFYATSHFLETLGCRWFFGNDIGTVVPSLRTVAVDELDIVEKPDFISRNVWGPNWRDPIWHLHNRCGGLGMPTGHDWQYVSAKEYYKEHPEYFSLRGGERRRSGWLCTSNPDVQRIFAENLSATVRGKEGLAVSISPPDGTSYCQCENCTALDDPNYIEPSSGHPVMTDRYMDFFNAVGKEVLKASPKAILNFYAYADYSLPPKRVKKAVENLWVWPAPIRFCRLHSMSNPLCKVRQRLRESIEGWQSVVSQLGWREYNYNLAELSVPFSKTSIWKDDIPYLHERGCIGLNIETLYLWHIYGPHSYLITRLAWDADADVDAIMDDFYTRFCGPAAPYVKAYWERIDKAYREADIHVGSFYGLHVIWTPGLVETCQEDLDAAAKAADTDLVKKRVEMFQMGLDNARYYLALRDATNRCDFVKAKEIYDRWIAHMDQIHASRIHYISEYKHGYVPRFLGKTVEEGYARITGDSKMLVQLPDEWLFRYDPDNEGENKAWHAQAVDPSGWQKVKTYSATLAEQGIGEVLTWMWYRTEFQVPDVPAGRKLLLWFAEVDGKPTRVFLNGELIGETSNSRKPFEMEVTGKLRKGRNVLAVKIDHRRISELVLGGIIKPVMVYSSPPAEE